MPNSEKGFNDICAYPTTNRVLFVLDGACGNNGDPTSTASRSGMRHAGFDAVWPPKGKAVTCQDCTIHTKSCTCRKDSWYPPETLPAIAFANIVGTDNPEMVFPFGDGTLRAYKYDGTELWSYDFAAHVGINPQSQAVECSEPTIADLNKDGVPEIIFNVFGYPSNPPSSVNNQRLIILSNTVSDLSPHLLFIFFPIE